tara:strand:- start:2766 stop:3539 length:774 start_codon:yes stop_codon:yes gene_type:complete
MANNGMNDTLALDDEDRLPWLEPAYEDDGEDEVSLLRLGALILAGLALLGLVVGGVYMIRNFLTEQEEPQVIAAPKGDYKIPAKSADAKKFQGEGDESFAASEGKERGGVIDASKLPEAPVTTSARADAAAVAKPSGPTLAGPKLVVPISKLSQQQATAKVTPAAPAKPAPSAAPAKPAAKAAGPMIQLGAYGSEALAKSSWTRLAKRFDYLGALTYHIEPVTVNGTQFYRLRAATAQASTLCGKLKVAGESCLVVN